jgi:outer membrane biosynthesis protein TonB
MNMNLATILALWVLTDSSVAAVVSPALPVGLVQESQPQSAAPQALPQQEPTQNPQPASPAQETPQPSQEPTPDKTEPEKAGPAPAQEPSKAPPAASAKKPPSTTKAATRRRRRRKHFAAKTDSAPEKKVVKNGGTADPAAQLAPGVSNEQASRQRQSTTQLLATTDTNLKQLASRQLSTAQQDSVSQIRKYMEQAKAAEDAGDVQRAQNLASKALMLSDDLVKH